MGALVVFILVAPLAGFGVLLLFGRRIGEPRAGYLGSATVAISFGLAAVASFDFLAGGDGAHPTTVKLFEWIPSLGLDATLLWDPLSAVMTLVITGVGTLIHVYSIGYMHGEPRFGRFFAYLNLFIMSMLILVLGDNFGVLFVGWELVGLSSYLLISFWFEKPAAAAAGKKAFVVNRIGDFGFLIALMLIIQRVRVSLLLYGVRARRCSSQPTAAGRQRRSPCCCWLVPPESRRSCRSTCGFPMPWRALRLFRL